MLYSSKRPLFPILINFGVILDFFLLKPYPTYQHIPLALCSKYNLNQMASPHFHCHQKGSSSSSGPPKHHLSSSQLCSATLDSLLFFAPTISKLFLGWQPSPHPHASLPPLGSCPNTFLLQKPHWSLYKIVPALRVPCTLTQLYYSSLERHLAYHHMTC